VGTPPRAIVEDAFSHEELPPQEALDAVGDLLLGTEHAAEHDDAIAVDLDAATRHQKGSAGGDGHLLKGSLHRGAGQPGLDGCILDHRGGHQLDRSTRELVVAVELGCAAQDLGHLIVGEPPLPDLSPLVALRLVHGESVRRVIRSGVAAV